MRVLSTLVLLAVGLGALAPGADAQNQAVSVIGGNVQINLPIIWGGSNTVVNQATRLQWRGTTNQATSKITVQTSVANQRFTLRLSAIPTSYGDSAGTVTLTGGMSARDLVVNIPKSKTYNRGARGEAPLLYEANATASMPAGQDQHTVLFTITQQ